MENLITETKTLLSLMQDKLHSEFKFTIEDNYVLEEGRNYIKLVRLCDNGSSSVCGFIVKKSPKKATDNKTDKSFRVGDMLMAASYDKPATNYARGNLFDGYDAKKITWTGIGAMV